MAPRGAENTVWLVGEGGWRGSCVVQYWLDHQKTQSFVGGGRESSACILFHLALEGASCLSWRVSGDVRLTASSLRLHYRQLAVVSVPPTTKT